MAERRYLAARPILRGPSNTRNISNPGDDRYRRNLNSPASMIIGPDLFSSVESQSPTDQSGTGETPVEHEEKWGRSTEIQTIGPARHAPRHGSLHCFLHPFFSSRDTVP